MPHAPTSHTPPPLARRPGAARLATLLTAAAGPLVLACPDPPAFARPATAILAAAAVLATLGSFWQAAAPRRAFLLRLASRLPAVTLATAIPFLLLEYAGATISLPGTALARLQAAGLDPAPTLRYLAGLLFWLTTALLALVHARRTRPPLPLPNPWRPDPPPPPPWNPATILLCLLGTALLAAAALEGHRTTTFLRTATHVPGTIADAQPHPRIRFATPDGRTIEFTQNGFVSRPEGAPVPVAFQPADPAGTARADTFWANWSDTLGLLWIGAGFTILPFWGFRAVGRPGRW